MSCTTPRATVEIAPARIGPPGSYEVRTACRHGAYRIGFAPGPELTQPAAVCAAIIHHHSAIAARCACMWALWPKYRTVHAPADLDGLRDAVDVLSAAAVGAAVTP